MRKPFNQIGWSIAQGRSLAVQTPILRRQRTREPLVIRLRLACQFFSLNQRSEIRQSTYLSRSLATSSWLPSAALQERVSCPVLKQQCSLHTSCLLAVALVFGPGGFSIVPNVYICTQISNRCSSTHHDDKVIQNSLFRHLRSTLFIQPTKHNRSKTKSQ